MRHLAALVLLTLLFLLSSCDDDSRGLMISGDGTLMSNSPANQRTRVISHIVMELNAQLGQHWLCTVAIAELPEYDEDFNRGYPDNWFWPKVTVQVALIGDGQQELPQTSQSLNDAVWEYMRRRVDRPKRNLTIEISTNVDAARFAALTRAPATPAAQPAGSAPPTPAAVPAQRVAGSRTYTVQEGDTLALISTAFYGKTSYWRLILQANPGLTGDTFRIGMVITIPPAPAP